MLQDFNLLPYGAANALILKVGTDWLGMCIQCMACMPAQHVLPYWTVCWHACSQCVAGWVHLTFPGVGPLQHVPTGLSMHPCQGHIPFL